MRMLPCTLFALAAVTLAGCGGSSHLQRYDFTGQDAAVIAAIPPRPLVFASGGGRSGSLLGAVLKAGTGYLQEREVQQAQERMDSALAHIDVASVTAQQTLQRSAQYLRYEPVDDPGGADFVLDLRVFEYGLVADSWDASLFFKLDAELLLVDAHTQAIIWQRHIQAVDPVTNIDNLGTAYGVGAVVGNVYTARALTQLSVEEMAQALEHLAAFTADRLTAELRHDFYRSRRKRKG